MGRRNVLTGIASLRRRGSRPASGRCGTRRTYGRHPLIGFGLAAAMLLTLCGVTVSGTAGAASSKAKPLQNLNFGLMGGMSSSFVLPVPNAVIVLAQTMGYYRKYGVNVSFTTLANATDALSALRSGAVDVVDMDPPDMFYLNSVAHYPLVAVDSTGLADGFEIVANKSIKSLSQLAGKSYAVDYSGSTDMSAAQAALKVSGINPSSLTYVPIGSPPTRATALADGKVDATTLGVGDLTELLAKDPSAPVHVLLSEPKLLKDVPAYSAYNVVTPATLKSKKTAIEGMVAAQIALARYFAKNPDAWAVAVAKFDHDSPTTLLEGDASAFNGQWCVTGCLSTSGAKTTEAFDFANTPDLKGARKVKVSQWLDQSILPAAESKLNH